MDSRPLKVFLCHAHPDAEKVRALYARLKADGVDAWLDKENIIPGQDWELEIRKAVRESDIVVVCLSKQFSQKGYRQNEVRIALDEASLQPEGEIFIIPARLEECNYLESLKRFHGVDLFEERGYEYLMRALRLRAEKIGAVLQAKKGWLNGFTAPVKKPAPKKPEPVKSQPTPKPEEPKPVVAQKPLRKWNTKTIAAIVGMVAIFATIFGLPWNQWFATTPDIFTVTPTNTVTFSSPQPTLTKVSSTSTFTPVSPTKTKSPTFTPTIASLPEEIIDDKGVAMRLVPVGDFIMGSDDDNSNGNPAHKVYLDSFYIDKFEVTNSEFVEFLKANQLSITILSGTYLEIRNVGRVYQLVCHTCPANPYTKREWVDMISWFGSARVSEYYEDFPVVFVSWDGADAYCKWRENGTRLPTEAEWEKAARGTDGRLFPWGNDVGWCGYGSVSLCYERERVGTYEDDKSPYGIFDMGGNVSEWVADWYDDKYYSNSPLENPQGPEFGSFRVFRGGSYKHNKYDSTYRDGEYQSTMDGYLGFRCARDANP